MDKKSKRSFFVKHKKLTKFEKYYDSDKWVIFSTQEYIVLNNKIFNLFFNLDLMNYQKIFENMVLNKKILLIGTRSEIINIYRWLQTKTKKVYVSYII